MQLEARAVSDTKHDRHVDILESVVTAGGTKDIEVPGYRVGRKTGTAKAVADDGIVLDGYTASLVGIAPVDDPQYVVVVNVRRSPLPRSRCPKSTESRARLVGRNHWGTLELPSAIRLHGGLYFVFMAVLTGLAIYVLILVITFLRLRIAEMRRAAPPAGDSRRQGDPHGSQHRGLNGWRCTTGAFLRPGLPRWKKLHRKTGRRRAAGPTPIREGRPSYEALKVGSAEPCRRHRFPRGQGAAPQPWREDATGEGAGRVAI